MKTIPSIDFHIEGLRLTSVVRFDDEFVVLGQGGSGAWYDGGKLESIQETTEYEAAFGVVDAPGWADRAQTLLDRWQREKTPLTATCLPHANVLTDGEESLVFPRDER